MRKREINIFQYAVLKNKKVLCSGTMPECSAKSGISESTLRRYSCRSHKELIAKKRTNRTYYEVIKLDEQIADELGVPYRLAEYAIYKGEELLFIGTLTECAEEREVRIETILFYLTPTYQKRVAKRKNPQNALTVTLLDDRDEE